MEKSLKIVYFGTPEFAAVPLRHLLQEGYNVVSVITVPDKPQGRGQNLQASAVAEVAAEFSIPVLKPKSLKSRQFLKQLDALKPDLGIVVAFRKLPKVVWDMPKNGTFNLHASILPDYRGAAPIHWAIIHGESQTGVTTFFLNDEIDAGKIILQKTIDIMPDDNTGTMYYKLMHLGTEVIVDTIYAVASGKAESKQQIVKGEVKMAPKIFKNDAYIDFKKSLHEIDHFIRGMNPVPGAFFDIEKEGKRVSLKISDAKVSFADTTQLPYNFYIEDRKLGITHKEGTIWLTKIQAPGKRSLAAHEFLNGWQDIENWTIVMK